MLLIYMLYNLKNLIRILITNGISFLTSLVKLSSNVKENVKNLEKDLEM